MKSPRLRVAAVAALACIVAACHGALERTERVVIVTFDTTRADRFGSYGYPTEATVNLDRFATEAVLFEHAVSPVPTTLPSHSTMFTGLYPHDHGVRYNLSFALGEQAFTLAEALKQAGFATAGFPASFIIGSRYGLNQGFDTYADPPTAREAALAPTPEAVIRPAEQGVDLALEWLGQHSGRSFVWLHFYEPHAPYTPPFPYSSTFRDRPYLGELAYTDAEFGRFLEALKQDPAWDRTLLVVAGDHGEGLHEHRERFHSYLVYEATQHVPLIVRAPGAPPHRVTEPVTLADVMPTILDLVGLDVPERIRGQSLRAALEGGSLERRDLYFESVAGGLNFGWAELFGVRFGKWKLIDSADPELYDLEADPGELRNLAGVETAMLDDLRQALAELKEPLVESAAVAAQEAVPNAETEALLASLGYVAGGSGGSSAAAAHPRDLIDLEQEMTKGREAVASQDWPALEEICRYVVKRDPSNKWALVNLVGALVSQGRAREAQDHAAKIVEFYPDQEASYAALAGTFQVQRDLDTAQDVIRTGLANIPGSEWLTYLSLLLGFEQGAASACGRDLDGALDAFADSYRVRVIQTRCEARRGDTAGALAALESAAELGFREFGIFDNAPEFAHVVDDPAFEELTARFPAKIRGVETIEE